MASDSTAKFAIRFGLAAIKAVGLNITNHIVEKRNAEGNFVDIYDFSKRIDNKFINKKSIEALAKSGSFDCLNIKRQQVAESFDILSAYSIASKEEANSNQLTFFAQENRLPALKKVADYQKQQKLQAEFEAFGFFLNEHPIDSYLSDLKKRGVVFADKLEDESLLDGSLLKMAGIITSSKHRSSGKGRFAYLYISDPFSIYEIMCYDENLITTKRDLLAEGSMLVFECLVKKDDGGTRILAKNIFRLNDFLQQIKPQEQEFADIRIIKSKTDNRYKKDFSAKPTGNTQNNTPYPTATTPKEEVIKALEISISNPKILLPLKTILAQKVSANSQEGVAIFLLADSKKILLAQKYQLNTTDIFRLQNLSAEIAIKKIV
jgi:DNA polymerase III alpha subunit